MGSDSETEAGHSRGGAKPTRARWAAAGLAAIILMVVLALGRLGLLFPHRAPAAETALVRDELSGHESQAWAVAKELIRLREDDREMKLPGYNWAGHVTYQARGRYTCEVPHAGGRFTVRFLLVGPADDIDSWTVVSYRRPS